MPFASAAETALMIPSAIASAKTYDELAMPVIIIAGEDDGLIDIDDGHTCALRREAQRGGASNAAAATRDQGSLTGESRRAAPSPSFTRTTAAR